MIHQIGAATFKFPKNNSVVYEVRPQDASKVQVGDTVQPMDDNWDPIPDTAFVVVGIGEPFMKMQGRKTLKLQYIYKVLPHDVAEDDAHDAGHCSELFAV